MGMKSEIEEALHAHTLWRTRFKDFLNGKAAFDIETISTTDQCDFGRWLDHEGHRMMPASLHDEICMVHKEFHLVAAGIIQKIKEKRFAEAKADISQDGALNKASMHLRDLLLKLSLREPGAAATAAPAAQAEGAATPQDTEAVQNAEGTPAPPGAEAVPAKAAEHHHDRNGR